MEDSSLHGFRFKPQSPLLVSDQGDVDLAEAEHGQWLEPLEYEALSPFPPSNHHEANQTPIADYHSDHDYHQQRFDDLFSRVMRRCYQGLRQSESMDSEADPIWYPSCSPMAQPHKVGDSDELMRETLEPEAPEVDVCSHEVTLEPVSLQYNLSESESDTSTVTMEDVSEYDNDAYEMLLDTEDEDAYEEAESFEDSESEEESTVDGFWFGGEGEDESEESDVEQQSGPEEEHFEPDEGDEGGNAAQQI
ncbi:hypothetical protein V8C37DRAFT_69105 [Trichoderma ceciliae]